LCNRGARGARTDGHGGRGGSETEADDPEMSAKVAFAETHAAKPWVDACGVQLAGELVDAAEAVRNDAAGVASFREEAIKALEAWAETQKDGRAVFRKCLIEAGYDDVGCVDLLEAGGPVVDDDAAVDELLAGAAEHNRVLLKSLREEKHGRTMLEQVRAEERKGWLRKCEMREVTEGRCLLARRFGRQELAKVRPIDDMSASGVNGRWTMPPTKLVYEGIDHLEALARLLSVKERGGLWKADIDSAYRRVAIAKRHRPLAAFAFLCEGEVVVAEHQVMVSVCAGDENGGGMRRR